MKGDCEALRSGMTRALVVAGTVAVSVLGAWVSYVNLGIRDGPVAGGCRQAEHGPFPLEDCKAFRVESSKKRASGAVLSR